MIVTAVLHMLGLTKFSKLLNMFRYVSLKSRILHDPADNISSGWSSCDSGSRFFYNFIHMLSFTETSNIQ